MNYTVYHIHVEPSLSSGYVGITKNVSLRWAQHSWQRKKSNPHLRNALLKYKNQIRYSIISTDLDLTTAQWIESILRPFPNMGWNITKGGGIPPNPKGKVRSEKHRQSISAAKLGVKNPMFGKKIEFSDEHRRNLSKALSGKTRPKAQGKARPVQTCPHCNKSGGDGAMKRWHFERCKHHDT